MSSASSSSSSSSSSSACCLICHCALPTPCPSSTCPFCEIDGTDSSFWSDNHNDVQSIAPGISSPVSKLMPRESATGTSDLNRATYHEAFKQRGSGMAGGTSDLDRSSCDENEDLDADNDGYLPLRNFNGVALERQNGGELPSTRAIIPHGLAEPLGEVFGDTGAEFTIQSFADLITGPDLQVLIRQIVEVEIDKYGSLPASKAAIEAMPFLTIGELDIEGDPLQCAVCREAFTIGGEVREMPCKHVYHNECILPWLNLHSSCPLCRHEMPVEAATCSQLPIRDAYSEATDNSRMEGAGDDHLAALIAIVGNNDRVLCLVVLEINDTTIRATFHEAREVGEVVEVEASHEMNYSLMTSGSPSARGLSFPDELEVSDSETNVVRSANRRRVRRDFFSGVWNQGLFPWAFEHRGSSRTGRHRSTDLNNNSATDDIEEDNQSITERHLER